MPKRRELELRFLITGGAGFIGCHLADGLSDDGHRVPVLDDLSTKARSPRGLPELGLAGLPDRVPGSQPQDTGQLAPCGRGELWSAVGKRAMARGLPLSRA